MNWYEFINHMGPLLLLLLAPLAGVLAYVLWNDIL